jgi:hypothetical protein
VSRPRDRTILRPKVGRTFLPREHLHAHELCFLLHDFLLELLGSAEQHGFFAERFEFRDENDRKAFEQTDDVFAWFEATGRTAERTGFLRRTVFPALLSDFLHFLYVSLEASRRGNLAVAYALLRKPLQEGLFLFEAIAADLGQFAECLLENPLLLRSQKAGGVDVHVKRIAKIIEHVDARDRFDAAYLAQLRYDKNAEDGFDGICNKAVHLFTEHPAIRTEKMNINFIFSNLDAKRSQWAYLYSRLPYVLTYAHLLVEYVFGSMHRSDDEYTGYMWRRLASSTALWSKTISPTYRAEQVEQFAAGTRVRLDTYCLDRGHPRATEKDLMLMREDGRWPGETGAGARLRTMRMNLSAKISRALRTRLGRTD